MGKVVIERCNYSSRRSWGPEGMVSGDSVCVSCGVGAVARRWHQSKSSLKCLNYSVEWSSMAFRSSSKLTLVWYIRGYKPVSQPFKKFM